MPHTPLYSMNHSDAIALNSLSPRASQTAADMLSAARVSLPHPSDTLDFNPALLREPRVRQALRQAWFQCSKHLHRLCLYLHLILMLIHIALVGVWAKGLEHRLVFSLEHQTVVSFLVTAITTAFATIYCAILVYVTQNLATRRNLEIKRTLTATHDTAAAWAGIGSATLRLWSQKTIPASVFGVLTVFLYLGNITILHITTPSLFSLQTSNFSRNITVRTLGLPSSTFDPSNETSLSISKGYVLGVLTSLPFIDSPHFQTIGLESGTLYEVPDLQMGFGNLTVQGTGFDVSCGAVTGGVNTNFGVREIPYTSPHYAWVVEFPDVPDPFTIYSTQPGIIAYAGVSTNNSYFYTTLPILDSHNDSIESQVELNPPMPNSVSSLAFFRCSQSLITQYATVDSHGNILALDPSIHKTFATWEAFNAKDSWTSGNSFLDAWGLWLGMAPDSGVARDWFDPAPMGSQLSVAEHFLNKMLELGPFASNFPFQAIAVPLHEVENALSRAVASMFWTLGHVARPLPNLIQSYRDVKLVISGEFPDAPFLLEGTTTATQIYTQTHLNLNVIAVIGGLSSSIALTFLALQFLTSPRNQRPGNDIPIYGTGLLHAIWLYRNHPELEAVLPQVNYPTEDNLREAGMVRARLIRRVSQA